jgi:hypothetical protein
MLFSLQFVVTLLYFYQCIITLPSISLFGELQAKLACSEEQFQNSHLCDQMQLFSVNAQNTVFKSDLNLQWRQV